MSTQRFYGVVRLRAAWHADLRWHSAWRGTAPVIAHPGGLSLVLACMSSQEAFIRDLRASDCYLDTRPTRAVTCLGCRVALAPWVWAR